VANGPKTLITCAPAATAVSGGEHLDLTGARSIGLVREQISEVIAAEGPVVVDRLLKTVASRFGLSKLHATRKEQLRALIGRDAVTVAPNGDVIAWPEGTNRTRYVGYRVPGPAGHRDLADIPYPELRNALLHVVRTAHGIGADDALRETAREFGITRLAAKVRERLLGVVSGALTEGVVRRDGDDLMVPSR
jgi:hypothetical protein